MYIGTSNGMRGGLNRRNGWWRGRRRRRRFKTSSTQWVLLYTRVVTDYLLERYERGIFGNYNHGDPSGEFSAIPMPATAAASGRRGIAAVLCSSTEYYRNPLVFHRTLRFFPTTSHPDVLQAAHAHVPLGFSHTYAPLNPIYFLHSDRLPAPRFCYCLFSFTRARDYLAGPCP